MFTEDLSDFLDETYGFAVSATIGASSVSGIFDNAYFGADFGVDVAGSKPSFMCKVAGLPSITVGTTTITINSVAYTIVDDQPDGQGMTVLTLRE